MRRSWLHHAGLSLCLGFPFDPAVMIRDRLMPELERRAEIQRAARNHDRGLVRCRDGVMRRPEDDVDSMLNRMGMHLTRRP
jgi:hypothetical protein